MSTMKGVVAVVLTLAACTQPTPPIEGPDVKLASDDALEQTLRNCMRHGWHGEPGAKYTEAYCTKAAAENFRRLRARRGLKSPDG